MDGLASILQRLRVILILAQNGAKLQLELTFVVHPPVTLRNALAFVEFRFANESNTLFEIEDALIKHTKPVGKNLNR